jgi:putative methionine-R-sulfoxide reductase with GAF domain
MTADRSIEKWLESAKQIAPEVCDWIGIYFKESFLTGKPSTDLVLGPFIGAETEHTRIPFSKGICGLAIREEKSINVEDVRARSEHIACSIHTRSELVIPLRDDGGRVVAELDIDCNRLAAFTPEIEKRFNQFALTFSKVIRENYGSK